MSTKQGSNSNVRYRTDRKHRARLARELIQRSECSEIIYAQHVERDGKLLFQEVCERNLEGIVCKRRMDVYAEHGWLKIKNPNYSQTEGRHEMFEAFSERRTSRKSPSAKL